MTKLFYGNNRHLLKFFILFISVFGSLSLCYIYFFSDDFSSLESSSKSKYETSANNLVTEVGINEGSLHHQEDLPPGYHQIKESLKQSTALSDFDLDALLDKFVLQLDSKSTLVNSASIEKIANMLMTFLEEDPQRAELFVNKILELEHGNNSSYKLASIIVSSDILQSDLIIQELLGRLVDEGTVMSNEKIIDIAQLSEKSNLSSSVVEVVKSFALYNVEDQSRKILALQQLHPDKFSYAEKQTLIADLSSILTSVMEDTERVNYLVETIITYSDDEVREQQLIEFLSSNMEFEIRAASIEAINNGVIKPSAVLEEELDAVASNPSDPLYNQAQVTLHNVFY